MNGFPAQGRARTISARLWRFVGASLTPRGIRDRRLLQVTQLDVLQSSRCRPGFKLDDDTKFGPVRAGATIGY